MTGRKYTPEEVYNTQVCNAYTYAEVLDLFGDRWVVTAEEIAVDERVSVEHRVWVLFKLLPAHLRSRHHDDALLDDDIGPVLALHRGLAGDE